MKDQSSYSQKTINDPDSAGLTPLHHAVLTENIENVKLLLNSEADVDYPDKNFWTPLHHAVRNQKIKIVKLLLNFKANINAKTKAHMTALHLASDSRNVEIIKLLLKEGANVTAKNNVGDTALHFAATSGNTNAIKALLEAGADIKAKNLFHDTALHCAVTGGHRDAIKALLEAGADVTAETQYGDNALTYAINYNKPKIIVYLVKYIANAKNLNINFKEKTVKTIIQSFEKNKFHEYNRKQMRELVTALAMFKTTEGINLDKKAQEPINFSQKKYAARQKIFKNYVGLILLNAILVIAAYVIMPATTTTTKSSTFVALAVIMTGLAASMSTLSILNASKIYFKNQENLNQLIKMPESMEINRQSTDLKPSPIMKKVFANNTAANNKHAQGN